MKRLAWIIALAFALGLILPVVCTAQQPDAAAPTQLRIVWGENVRDSLARAWSDDNPRQVERFACLTYTVARAPVRVLEVTLTGFVDADTVFGVATPYSVGFHCPRRSLSLHTHPPVTCPLLGAWDHDWSKCKVGGVGAYLCFPSEQDKKSLAYEGKDIGFVQCDRHGVVAFFPAILPGGQ